MMKSKATTNIAIFFENCRRNKNFHSAMYNPYSEMGSLILCVRTTFCEGLSMRHRRQLDQLQINRHKLATVNSVRGAPGAAVTAKQRMG